jgi:hypothetical protein
VTDPLKLKKYNSPHYKLLYTICVLIPVFLSFSLVFFLIFFMSPRGQHMRVYQRDIYEWNKDNLSTKMAELDLAFKISPTLNNKNY